MKRLKLALLIVAALAVLWLMLSRPLPRRASGGGPEANAGEEKAMVPASTAVRAPVVRSKHDPGRSNSTQPSMLNGPLSQEHAGMLGKLYALWSRQPEDPMATKVAVDYLADAFASHDIYVRHQFVRCSTALCRGRFRFDDLKDLYKLQEIEPDGLERLTTYPVEWDHGEEIAVYWSKNKLDELAASFGDD